MFPNFQLRILCAALAGIALAITAVTSAAAAPMAPAQPRARQSTSGPTHAMLAFEENRGQFGNDVRFLARTATQMVAVDSHGIRLVSLLSPPASSHDTATATAGQVAIGFAGTSAKGRIVGESRLPGVVHYLRGAKPERWLRDIPTYARVRYSQVYPGVDAVLYAGGGGLELDFELAPHADPSVISLIPDAASAARAPDGSLTLERDSVSIRINPPRSFQTIQGHRCPVDSWLESRADGILAIGLGPYDRDQPLVIDPVVEWGCYLGGDGADEAVGVAVAPDGSVVVAEWTLPAPLSHEPLDSTPFDAAVLRLSSDGTTLLSSTILGGGAQDLPRDVTVDGTGRIVVVGRTFSADFPVKNALQPKLAGASDAFVTELSPDGRNIVYSTFLGSEISPAASAFDQATGVAVDTDGSAVVVGEASGPHFPRVNELQAGPVGYLDWFIARFSPNGDKLTLATLFGGSRFDMNPRVALDAAGNIVVAGDVMSGDMPTVRPLQPANAGQTDIFIASVPKTGHSVSWATYLGGSDYEHIGNVALGPGGDILLAGTTYSPDFPTQSALMPEHPGGIEAFVTRLSRDGTTVRFSTYLGGYQGEGRSTGSGYTYANAGCFASDGSVVVAGASNELDYPLADPFQYAPLGADGGFITQLSPDGQGLTFSSRIGGLWSKVTDVTAAPDGGLVAAGVSSSPDLPATAGTYDPACNESAPCEFSTRDGFVVRLRPGLSTIHCITAQPSELSLPDLGATSTVTVTIDSPVPNDLTIRLSGSAGSFVRFPSTVTLPAEQRAVSFPVTATYYTYGDATSTLVATLPVNVGACAASVRVRVPYVPGLWLSLSGSSIMPGQHVQLTAQIAIAPTNDETLTITCSDPSVLSAPATATIKAGTRDAILTLTGLAPGTATLTVTPPPSVRPPGTRPQVTVALPTAPLRYDLAAVVHTGGAGGTKWRTDVAVVNAAAWPNELELTYAWSGGRIGRTVNLGPSATREWRDVAVSLFGLDPSASASGRVEISAALPVAVSSRIYNDTPTGSFGQSYPGFPPTRGYPPGTVAYLPLLRRTSDFRSNVGFVCATQGSACRAILRLFRDDGVAIGQSRTVDLHDREWLQIFDTLSALGAGTAEHAYASVEVLPGDGVELWAYASLVDNRSGDPTTLPALAYGANTYLVPGVAQTPGSFGTSWRTELALLDVGTGSSEVTLAYFPTGSTDPPTTRTVVLQPKQALHWGNVLGELFQWPVGQATSGTLHISTVSAPFHVVARSYTEASSGSYGQELPALPESVENEATATAGTVMFLPQLRGGTSFRTNVGFISLQPVDIPVRLTLFDADGHTVGEARTLTVGAGRWTQIDDVFSYVGAPAAELAYAVVEPQYPWPLLWAYASVIDNRTGDPTTVPGNVFCAYPGICN